MQRDVELLSAEEQVNSQQQYLKLDTSIQRPHSLWTYVLYGVILVLSGLLVITTVLTIVGFSVNREKSSPTVKPSEEDDSPLVIDLITFNDVYQIDMVPINDAGQLGGGASRVSKYIKEVRHRRRANPKNVLVLSGGDMISPSGLSTLFYGKQIIEVNNIMGLSYSVLGNHEFDYGVNILGHRMLESNFTWLCSNIEMPLPIQKNVIVQTMNKTIGIFGLIYDFIPVDKRVIISDVKKAAQEQIAELKAAGADYIIALTHLEADVDCELSFLKDLNLIVGGHDHRVKLNADCGPAVYLKATMDWINIWHVRIDFSFLKPVLQYTSIPITKDLPTDPIIDSLIVYYNNAKESEFKVTLAKTLVPLEARATILRTKESNFANYCCDRIRSYFQSDLTFMNGGGIRSNKLYPANSNITKGDLRDMFPFQSGYVVVSMNGTVLMQAVEHGVAHVETNHGKFPQISGFRYEYAPKQPKMQRVTKLEKSVNGTFIPIQPEDVFSVAIDGFLYKGGDGYALFTALPLVSIPGDEPTISNIINRALVQDKVISPALDGRITEFVA